MWAKGVVDQVMKGQNIGRICIICPNFRIKQAIDRVLKYRSIGKEKIVVIFGKYRVRASTYYYINMPIEGRGVFNYSIKINVQGFSEPKVINEDIKYGENELNDIFDEISIADAANIF